MERAPPDAPLASSRRALPMRPLTLAAISAAVASGEPSIGATDPCATDLSAYFQSSPVRIDPVPPVARAFAARNPSGSSLRADLFDAGPPSMSLVEAASGS